MPLASRKILSFRSSQTCGAVLKFGYRGFVEKVQMANRPSQLADNWKKTHMDKLTSCMKPMIPLLRLKHIKNGKKSRKKIVWKFFQRSQKDSWGRCSFEIFSHLNMLIRVETFRLYTTRQSLGHWKCADRPIHACSWDTHFYNFITISFNEKKKSHPLSRKLQRNFGPQNLPLGENFSKFF